MKLTLPKPLAAAFAIGVIWVVGVECRPTDALAVAAPSPNVGRPMIPDAIDRCPVAEESIANHPAPDAANRENCDSRSNP